MNPFRIGKLFGIDIQIDASWIFLFVLLLWNLTSVFTGWHPEWSGVESFGVALAAALLFFGCIVVHELAHSLVARRYGLRVRSITLFLLGGVSDIEREPPSPRAELVTAIVGPLASIVVGLVFLVLTAVATSVSVGDARTAQLSLADLGPLATLLAWLGPINLVIGVFNLVPAFPLDGGRVLRSILWSAGHDLTRATRQVAAVGQIFGWTFILLGIAMVFGIHIAFFGSGLVGGLWLAFIGWFLHSAALQSYRRLTVDRAMAGHVVGEVMRRSGPAVTPDLSLESLVHDHMILADNQSFPVIEGGRLVGMVARSDVRAVPSVRWATTPVRAVMRPDTSLPVAWPQEDLAQAFEQLARGGVEEVPVVDHGRLVGMLFRNDVARWLDLTWSPRAHGRA